MKDKARENEQMGRDKGVAFEKEKGGNVLGMVESL